MIFEKSINWAYQWKMQFNPVPKKQANKASFFRNQIHVHTLQYISVTILSLHVLIKSTGGLSLIQN